jgi:hypothetical protein
MKQPSIEKVVNLRIRKPVENISEPVTEQIIFVDNDTNPYIKTPVSFIKTPVEENNIKNLPPLPPSPKTPIE